MTKKLNCILLIDDDEATNFLHTLIIEELQCTEKVIAVDKAEKALEYLQAENEEGYLRPDLILLDINMPAMDGWDFLDEYKKLDETQRAKIIIVMLTTSLNPDHEEKAKTYEEINGFRHKPLSIPMLKELLKEYFEEA